MYTQYTHKTKPGYLLGHLLWESMYLFTRNYILTQVSLRFSVQKLR